MSVQPPTLQALPNLPPAVPRARCHPSGQLSWNVEIYPQVLKPHTVKEVYRVFIPKDDDVVWCCLLSYVNSFSDVRQLENSLSNLKLCKNKSVVRQCLFDNNPFLNRNKCLYDKNLQDMLHVFNQKIQSFPEGKLAYSPHLNCRRIEAAAEILSCNILFLLPAPQNAPTKFFYFPQFEAQDYEKFLIIFLDFSDGQERFSFGMDKDIGSNKQKQALRELLKRANLGKTDSQLKGFSKQMCSLPGIDKHFLISLIKNEQESIIPVLFKSPYIVSKLHDAGFSTDPRQKDERGLSAFFHALRLEHPDVLYFLYDHALRFYLDSEASVRSPNSVIVDNLLTIKDELNSLRSMPLSENPKIVAFLLGRIDEICRFNAFQREMCGNIMNLRLEINYYDDKSEISFEADKRKSIILDILKNYMRFFHWDSSASELTQFNDFVKQGVFAENLDFCCAILFFDNLYSLKERLKASQNVYKNIESQFFFYIYSVKYFKFTQADVRRFDLESIIIKMVLFKERLVLLKNVESFRRTLDCIEISDANVVEALPETEVQNLMCLPEIYNEFFIHRLRSYLNTAIICPKEKSIKYVLVIERALQILGESVKNMDSEFNPIQNTLCHCLPVELVQSLKRIRNNLSHLEAWQLSWRQNAESDMKLFCSVQKELVNLNENLKPFFQAQKYASEQFILNISLKAVGRSVKGSIPKNISEIKVPYSMAAIEGTEDEIKDDDFEKNWKTCLKLIYDKLRSQIITSNKDKRVLNKNNRSHFQCLLKNALNAVKEKLKKFQSNGQNKNETVEMFKPYHDAVQYFLKLLATDKEVAVCRREILNALRQGQSLFNPHKKEKKERSETKSEPSAQDKHKTLIAWYSNTLCQTEKENISDNSPELSDSVKKDRCTPPEPGDDKSLNQIMASDSAISRGDKGTSDKLLPVEEIFKNYEQVTDKIFSRVQQENFQEQTFGNLKKLELILKGYVFLSEEQKSAMKHCVEENFEDILDENNFMYDYYSELTTAMDDNEINKKRCDVLCKKLQLPEKHKNVLERIVKGQNRKIPQDKLKFLNDRVMMLKTILIDENPDIKQLHVRAKSKRAQIFIHEKLVQLFHSDSEFQASVEMLLFDCMNILRTKELKSLWRKTSNLFSGINVRNVLAHGNPLLESLGKLLDPDDLPSEMIRQMLHLVSDSEAINAMVEVLEKEETDFAGFVDIMNSNEKPELTPLVEKIKKSDRWDRYAFLIPRKWKKSSDIVEH